ALRRMKIVHLATTLRGGAGIALQRQHAALLAAGADSRIVLSEFDVAAEERLSGAPRAPVALLTRVARRLGIASDAATRLAEKIPAPGTPPKFELFSSPFSPWAPESHPWVREADVVNIHWVSAGLDWPRFFAAVERPVVFTLHDQQPYLGGFHYELDRTRNPQMAGLESEVAAIKRAALGNRRCAIAGNSEWNTAAALGSGFYPTSVAARTIHYAFNASRFAPRPAAAARVALGVEENRFTVGFACEDLANHRKGFDLLLAALGQLPPALRARLQLLSFGRKPTAALTAQAGELPWTHLGHLDADATKAAVYSAMDLFVAPSRAEAFGQTALEAIACGTPVAAAADGGLREALAEGRGGLLFPPDDAAALAKAVAESVERAPALREKVAAVRPELLARHAPARCASAYLDLYRTLTAARA
ncbi:MAG TPA: glycosyltransferase, partial [Opitutaceae bacterium]